MSECGCKVGIRRGIPGSSFTISYCALHKAAPKLLDCLKLFVDDMADDDLQREIEQLIVECEA